MQTPMQTPTSAGQAQAITIGAGSPTQGRPGQGPSHAPAEILSCDWNKYHSSVLATAGKDGAIKVWDLRNTSSPAGGGGIGNGNGNGNGIEVGRHALAARKVQWSPHRSDRLASVSYDMTCRV